MGNLCSIFHVRFKNLMKVIPSARKAQLVDYILLGWQSSTYKLKNSNHVWFMKPYAQIVEETGIPTSTLERYIKELHEDGFIERRQALYCRTKEHGQFAVKKGTYIYITEKLLALIKHSNTVSEPQPVNPSLTHNNPHDDNQKDHENKDNRVSNCINSNPNEGTESLKTRELYIRDLYSSFSINNIILKKSKHHVDNATLQRQHQQFATIKTLLYSEVKEEISEVIKKMVLGTFFNLTFEQQKQFSSPKQVVAEYLFSLLNVDFYLPKVTCFKHRNNILSKVIQSNQWRTPKGFYKHFYLGQNFKDQQELHEKRQLEEKNREMNLVYDRGATAKDARLSEIESQMYEKGCLIERLTQSIYQQAPHEELITNIQEQIQNLKRELESLWHQQTLIEQENELKHYLAASKRCA